MIKIYQAANSILKIRNFLILSLFLSFYGLGNAQEKYTISGTVSDSSNGEELIGASVWISELSTGNITNEYGFYSITIPEGNYTLNISYVGYVTVFKELHLTKNIVIK